MRVLGSLFILVAIGGFLYAFAAFSMAETIGISHAGEIAISLIIAAIFLVLGLICIVAGGPRKVQIVQHVAPPIQEMKQVDSKTCPSCAEEVKKEAKICRFCNHSFLLTAPIKKYYCQLTGTIDQLGPYDSDEILSMIQNNQLGSEDQGQILTAKE